MPYIQRDEYGNIQALSAQPSDGGEFMAPTNPAVLRFLMQTATTQGAEALMSEDHLVLQQADLDLIRVIEDVIELLIDKNVFMFSELPLPVQQKLLNKRGHRQRLSGAGGGLLTGEDDIL